MKRVVGQQRPRRKPLARRCALAVTLTIGLPLHSAAQEAKDIGSATGESATGKLENLVPPLANSSLRLRFHLGQVANNGATISPILPDMPFPISPYYVVQWNQASYVRPDILLLSDKATYDDRLGVARFAFEAEDGHAHVWLYPFEGSNWVYELYETDGSILTDGGSNLLLSTDQFINASFAHKLQFDFDGKLSKAAVYGSDQAKANGSVLSQVLSGFGLRFTDPGHVGQNRFVFLHIPISSSQPLSRKAQFFCRNGVVWLYSPELSSGEELLPFQPDAGPLHHFHYALNRYLRDLLTSRTCGDQNWPRGASDSSNWEVTGFYIGLETETIDRRRNQIDQNALGTLETGLQIANIRLTAD